MPSQGKDEKPSLAKGKESENSKDGAPPPVNAIGQEEHVSGPPERQTFFGSLKKMGMQARESMRNLKEKYVPGKDVGDGPEPVEVEGRPKTGSSKIKSSTDDDGPVWEPGTEQLMWTDPKYVVTSYVMPGIHPNHSKHFVKPEKWWQRCVSGPRHAPVPPPLVVRAHPLTAGLLQRRGCHENARAGAPRSQG
jgi:hypothetical protein